MLEELKKRVVLCESRCQELEVENSRLAVYKGQSEKEKEENRNLSKIVYDMSVDLKGRSGELSDTQMRLSKVEAENSSLLSVLGEKNSVITGLEETQYENSVSLRNMKAELEKARLKIQNQIKENKELVSEMSILHERRAVSVASIAQLSQHQPDKLRHLRLAVLGKEQSEIYERIMNSIGSLNTNFQYSYRNLMIRLEIEPLILHDRSIYIICFDHAKQLNFYCKWSFTNLHLVQYLCFFTRSSVFFLFVKGEPLDLSPLKAKHPQIVGCFSSSTFELMMDKIAHYPMEHYGVASYAPKILELFLHEGLISRSISLQRMSEMALERYGLGISVTKDSLRLLDDTGSLIFDHLGERIFGNVYDRCLVKRDLEGLESNYVSYLISKGVVCKCQGRISFFHDLKHYPKKGGSAESCFLCRPFVALRFPAVPADAFSLIMSCAGTNVELTSVWKDCVVVSSGESIFFVSLFKPNPCPLPIVEAQSTINEVYIGACDNNCSAVRLSSFAALLKLSVEKLLLDKGISCQGHISVVYLCPACSIATFPDLNELAEDQKSILMCSNCANSFSLNNLTGFTIPRFVNLAVIGRFLLDSCLDLFESKDIHIWSARGLLDNKLVYLHFHPSPESRGLELQMLRSFDFCPCPLSTFDISIHNGLCIKKYAVLVSERASIPFVNLETLPWLVKLEFFRSICRICSSLSKLHITSIPMNFSSFCYDVRSNKVVFIGMHRCSKQVSSWNEDVRHFGKFVVNEFSLAGRLTLLKVYLDAEEAVVAEKFFEKCSAGQTNFLELVDDEFFSVCRFSVAERAKSRVPWGFESLQSFNRLSSSLLVKIFRKSKGDFEVPEMVKIITICNIPKTINQFIATYSQNCEKKLLSCIRQLEGRSHDKIPYWDNPLSKRNALRGIAGNKAVEDRRDIFNQFLQSTTLVPLFFSTNVNIVTAFRGIRSLDAAKEIARVGFDSNDEFNKGEYGKGILLDLSLPQAHRNCKFVLLCRVAISNVYPVIENAFSESSLMMKELVDGYDCHFVSLAESDSWGPSRLIPAIHGKSVIRRIIVRSENQIFVQGILS